MDDNLSTPAGDGVALSAHESLTDMFKAELAAERAPPKAEKTSAMEPETPETVAPETESETVEDETESEVVEAEDTATDEADDAAETPSDDEPIAAPSGMSDADRQVYAKLPTELKAWVAKQEASRTADYTRKSQAIAEQKRQYESALPVIAQKLQILDANLARFTDNDVAPPDPALRYNDPDTYNDQLANYMQAQHVKEIAARERQKIQAEHEAVTQQQMREFEQQRSAQLRERAPELFGEKGKVIGNQIQTYALKSGYTSEQLRLATATDIITLHKAQQFDAIQAQKKQVKTVAPSALKVTKPGPAKAVGRPSAVSSAIKALDQKPSRDNLAAAYLAEIRSEKR